MFGNFRRPTRRHTLMIGAWAASILVVAAASATAAGMITGKQIKNGTVTGVDVKNGSLGWGDLSPGARTRLINRAVSKAKNSAGPSSAAAPVPGAQGEKGPQGPKGDTGPQGPKGADAPDPEYGIGGVWLDRGTGYGLWGSYASPALPSIGSIPAMTSGQIRFTCSDKRPVKPTPFGGCKLKVTGVVASNSSTDPAHVQSHIQIERTSDAGSFNNSGTAVFCEADEAYYQETTRVPLVDGVTTASQPGLLQSVGGSVDCGGGANFKDPVANVDEVPGGEIDVHEYVLPVGYYNITTTFRFYGA